MTKPIITRVANLGHRRVDHELVRRVLAMKEQGYCDEVRVVRAMPDGPRPCLRSSLASQSRRYRAAVAIA